MKSGRRNVAVFLLVLTATVVYSVRRKCVKKNAVHFFGIGRVHPRIECELKTDSISTFVLGDWGGETDYPHTTEAQVVCANFISRMGPEKNPDFFTGTGDNFYYYGINESYGVDDTRFWYTFENAFPYGRGDNGTEKIPWYIILGNHDYYGDVKAQVEYSKRNSRWVLPDYSYSVKYTTAQNLSAEFIYIDTQILCGGTWDYTANVTDPYNSARRGRRRIVPVGPDDPKLAKATFKWINDRLKTAKSADYLFVVGHYPIFSTVFPQSECLVKYLLPMLHEHKVTGYICGHEHNLQYMTTEKDGHVLHHLLSGAVHETEAIFTARTLEDNPWNWESRYFFPQAPSRDKIVYEEYGAMMHMELTPDGALVDFYHCSHHNPVRRGIPLPRRKKARLN